MKLLKIFALGFVAYVIGAFVIKLNRGRTVTEAATQSIAEPVGLLGSALTLAVTPSKWGDVTQLTTEAGKAVAAEPTYDRARAVSADYVTQFFGLASEVPAPESVSDANARTLSETQVPGTLEANPSTSRGTVYSGTLY